MRADGILDLRPLHYEQAEVEAYVQMVQAEFDPDLVTVRKDQIGGAKVTEPPLPVVGIRSPTTPAKVSIHVWRGIGRQASAGVAVARVFL